MISITFLSGTLIIGLGIAFLSYSFKQFKKCLDTEEWVYVEANILRSEYKKQSGDKGISHWLILSYEYEVDNKIYQSDRLTYSGGSGDYDNIMGFVDNFPVGSMITAFYNPQEPNEAVIQKGATMNDGIFVILSIGVIALGFFIIFVLA